MASVEVDIFGRDVIVPDVANICTDYATMSSAARDAIAGEVSLSAYRSVDYILPGLQGDVCGWAGMAELHGNTSWNLGSGGQAPSFGTIVHEWGHQYSLPHLRAIRCTKDGQDVHLVDRTGRAAGQCATAEYGGAFSIMGPSWANNSAALTFGERAQLGWLRDGEERKVHEGTFTLGYDGPLSLLWLQNSEGDLFQIEFVKSFTGGNSYGFTNPFTRLWHWLRDTPNFTHPGVMVKYVSQYSAWAGYPAGYYAEGLVIDATPQTILSTDAAFQAGTSFVDPTGSLTVEILSVTDQSAEVRVRGVPHKPGLVNSLQATATETRGVFDVSFHPTVADPPVTHYEIQVSKDYEFTNPQTFTVSASPGRVIIPQHIDLWTLFRIAAVSSVGRGEFSSATLLRWSSDAKLQRPGLVNSLQATATDVVGVFDVSFQAAVSASPVTHYEIQVSKDYEFTNPQTFIVKESSGRVIIPQHIDLWTLFRIAAVSSVGRGEFSSASRIEWSSDAKLQRPDAVRLVQATATDVVGVFDVSFQAAVSASPVTHYEIQVSKDYEFTNPQTLTLSSSSGRVIIPNHINFWTIFRVAAVSGVGRGEFSSGSLLQWSSAAKLQGAAEGQGKPARSVVCKKNQKVRTFARAACPSGWRKVG